MREKVTTFPLRYPALMFLRQIFFLGLAISFLLFPAGSLSAEDDQKRIPRGGCPDLIDLIKELTPVVVNISIERHLLQNTFPPPLPFSGQAEVVLKIYQGVRKSFRRIV